MGTVGSLIPRLSPASQSLLHDLDPHERSGESERGKFYYVNGLRLERTILYIHHSWVIKHMMWDRNYCFELGTGGVRWKMPCWYSVCTIHCRKSSHVQLIHVTCHQNAHSGRPTCTCNQL